MLSQNLLGETEKKNHKNISQHTTFLGRDSNRAHLEYRSTALSFLFNLCGGTLGTAATIGLLYQPRMMGNGDCEEIGGIKIGKGN
jgi:hypothetical protein